MVSSLYRSKGRTLEGDAMKKNLLEEWIAHCDNARAIGQEPCLESFEAMQTTADSLKAWAEHGITEQMITDFINQL